MPNSPLDILFSPKSIAVVGVSDNSTKLSSVIFNNILDANFAGNVYPVNPKYQKVLGYKCYGRVCDIEEVVDLAVVVVPAQSVLDVVKDAGEKKVANMIIISAGFGETGKEGAKLEEEVLKEAQRFGIRILGPNCLGIMVPGSKLNASFAMHSPKKGNIAFLSQSGAFNTAMLDLADQIGVGFSHFVSLGNKSDLNELDFMESWLQDDGVEVIGMYLEEFADGKDLLDIIKTHPSKPILMLVPGKSAEAQKAISSHTGSLAGKSEVVRAALAQAGVMQVESVEKMFNSLRLFSVVREVKGNRVAIVTNAGGPGIMITDMLVDAGLELAELEDKTKDFLKGFLPATASLRNPVDLVGDAQADRYSAALDIVQKDPNVDILIAMLTPQYVTQIEETADIIIKGCGDCSKPVIPLFMGGKYIQAGLDKLYKAGKPGFVSAEEAVAAAKNLVQYSEHVGFRSKVKRHGVQTRKPRYHGEVMKFVGKEVRALPQSLTTLIAREVGFTMPRESTVSEFGEAQEFAVKIGFPVVLKATAEDIPHKTEEKAVYVGIKNEGELRNAFAALSRSIRGTTGKKSPLVLVQEQIIGGEELIIGVSRDGDSRVYEDTGKGFGHILLFGKGGIYTEVYKDVAVGLVPMSESEMEVLVKKTKTFEIIAGARGKDKLAYAKLLKTLRSAQSLVMMYPEIESIDINPAIINTKDVLVVDLKVFVRE